jgi:hypothetical protein
MELWTAAVAVKHECKQALTILGRTEHKRHSICQNKKIA